jgi:hypothetical protein
VGSVVLLTLTAPREKFWGAVLGVAPAGISIRAVRLESFDDLVRLIKSGEPAAPGDFFFPMHRVERMELDAPTGEIPSLSERFQASAGRQARSFFAS